jgi:hypothetical protein
MAQRGDAEGGRGPGLLVKLHEASVLTTGANHAKSWGTLEEDDIF